MSEQKNPWAILSEKKIYDNPWINVTEFAVINPNGGNGIYGKVHFKNLAIGILPLDKNMNTYLVGQYRFPLDQYSWEIPEGGGKIGIDPLISAQRELIEETGLIAVQWKEILRMHLSNSVTDEYAIIYIATGLEQMKPMPEETEKIAIKKLPFEEAYKMVQEGLITDSMSVAAIQKVKLMQLDGTL
ncbi:MAG: NUDIX hydrolase [Bacteroidetes bacterium]|nr:NUDIX hydrolase [Bacteroidota bacterium]